MPKGLKRYYGRGHPHFLTFSCYRRLPQLNAMRARNVFVEVPGKIRERYKFLLLGYVVMPNHAHLLISESAEGTDLPPNSAQLILRNCLPGSWA